MSTDYQILAFRRPAKVKSVGLATKSPPVLEIVGEGFDAVAEVRVNGTSTREFVVMSPTRLLVTVPPQYVKTGSVESVSVLLSAGPNPSSEGAALVVLQSSVAGSAVSGFSKLVQSFILLLLTTPGTNLFAPTTGGGLLALAGSTERQGQVRAAVSLAITETAKQLIRMQATESRLAASEKLASATILDTRFVAQQATLYISIRITAVDGSTTAVVTSV
jgi:hypothetical protein